MTTNDSDGSVLDWRSDPYGGVNIKPEALAPVPEDFASQLTESMEAWRKQNRRGVWLKIPIEHASLVPVAASQGFVYHHAEKDYVMMTHWLPVNEPNPLPPNASTQVGVGAVVTNDQGQVLLVQEAYGPTAGKDIWKIPTGLLDAREDSKLCASVV